jgi:predicted DCC family thiol-disulfide oxidoreductase YuxK
VKSSRFEKFRRYFTGQYMTVDARSLGLGRIVLAVILLVDLLRRIPDITLFYSNQGLIPNHMMLWRPPTQWMFSFFFILSHPDEVAFAFVVCGLIYLLLMVGWRTRLMHFLALICVLSLHGRVTLLENGGDWMLGELTLWTCFLPTGRRFSIDALRASLRARRETSAAQLADRKAMDVSGSVNVVSLAVLALALQIANSYIFNALHKGGPTWREGTAVHYVMHQDRMCTWLAVWMRPHMTMWLSRILSWGALATEAILPVMLLAPVQKVSARRVAIVCVIGLHTGFQLFINLGIFSFAMIGYTPFLLTGADWEALARFARRHKRRLVAYFDAGCGVCFQLVRVWARLDTRERIDFRSSADLAGAEAAADAAGSAAADAGIATKMGVTPELLARTIVVVDELTGVKYTRADAVAQMLRALPVGWLWSLPLRLPGLRGLANWAYDAFARRRETISSGMGLAACNSSLPLPSTPGEGRGEGAPEPAPSPESAASPESAPSPEPAAFALPVASQISVASQPVAPLVVLEPVVAATAAALASAVAVDPAGEGASAAAAPIGEPVTSEIAAPLSVAAVTATPTPAPIVEAWRWLLSFLREGVVLAFIITMVSETLFINAAVPKFLKHEQPLWIKRLVAYPRLIQAWSMFASDAPVGDQTMVVDAVTVDGRHVDPYSEATSRYKNPGREEIPDRLDNDSFVFNYSGRIPNSGAYHQALTEWILAYHERTGNPQDRIIRFDAYEVDDDSPPVGQLKPRNIRSHSFLSYPAKR